MKHITITDSLQLSRKQKKLKIHLLAKTFFGLNIFTKYFPLKLIFSTVHMSFFCTTWKVSKYGNLFNVNIKILIFQVSWYKNEFVCFSVKFRRWFNVDKHCFDVEKWLPFQCYDIKILQDQDIRTKLLFIVNAKSM